MAIPLNAQGAALNSWKEIAAYLGRGVRTVQRYEHDLGLPVRRPRGTSRSAVIALTSDLDSWLRATPTGKLLNGKESDPVAAVAAVRTSVGCGAELRDQCHALRAAHEQAVAKLIMNLTGLVQEIHVSTSLKNRRGGQYWRDKLGLSPTDTARD